MKYIDLSNQFKTEKKDKIPFEEFQFPSGAWHFRLPALKESKLCIMTQLQSGEAIVKLLLMTDAIRRQGVEEIHLFLPYVPYARQDRVAVEGEPLSIAVIAQLLNSQNYASVEIFDPHSSVTPALIHRVKTSSTTPFLNWIAEQLPENYVVVSPDAGAEKRTAAAAKTLQAKELIFCSKVRDVVTGKLKDFQVYTDDLQGKACLIVDDICDGGGTFLGIAQALKTKGAGKIYLAVSHGIFSKGMEPLKEHFEQVFTTDSFANNCKADEFLKIFKIASSV